MERNKAKSMAATRVAQNTSKAVALRLSGESQQVIADKLRLTQARISQMLKVYFDAVREKTLQGVEELFGIELSRLDALLIAQWPMRKIAKNATVILAILERRHKLLGIEAPTKMQIGALPTQIMGPQLDLNKLNDEELGWLEIILEKAGPQADPTVVATQGRVEHEHST